MIKPCLKILISSSIKLITVDSIPISHFPPSRIYFIFPSSSLKTSSADVGEIRPALFADGAATGNLVSSKTFLKTGCEGILNPTLSLPADTISGIKSFFFNTKVIGPGENFSASL